MRPPSRKSAKHSSLGVTLIELLMVMGIIGIMLSLLLPAIQAVRTSSLRTSCQNNRRNLDLALRNYISARNSHFPASPYDDRPSGWAIEIMPFVEAQAWRDRFVLDAPLSDPRNLAAAGDRPSVFVCPFADYRDSAIAGIPAADYVLFVDAATRRLPAKRVYWRLMDTPVGSRIPWCLGPELGMDQLTEQTYEHPHPAEGGLAALIGD